MSRPDRAPVATSSQKTPPAGPSTPGRPASDRGHPWPQHPWQANTGPRPSLAAAPSAGQHRTAAILGRMDNPEPPAVPSPPGRPTPDPGHPWPHAQHRPPHRPQHPPAGQHRTAAILGRIDKKTSRKPKVSGRFPPHATRITHHASLLGNLTTKRLPSPTTLSTSTLPPIASVSSLTSARPSPTPRAS